MKENFTTTKEKYTNTKENECYNCKYLEFDMGLCTQYFCRYHEKLIKQDDSCENWIKKE